MKKYIGEVSEIYPSVHSKRQNCENFFPSPVAAGEVWQSHKDQHCATEAKNPSCAAHKTATKDSQNYQWLLISAKLP